MYSNLALDTPPCNYQFGGIMHVQYNYSSLPLVDSGDSNDLGNFVDSEVGEPLSWTIGVSEFGELCESPFCESEFVARSVGLD